MVDEVVSCVAARMDRAPTTPTNAAATTATVRTPGEVGGAFEPRSGRSARSHVPPGCEDGSAGHPSRSAPRSLRSRSSPRSTWVYTLFLDSSRSSATSVRVHPKQCASNVQVHPSRPPIDAHTDRTHERCVRTTRNHAARRWAPFCSVAVARWRALCVHVLDPSEEHLADMTSPRGWSRSEGCAGHQMLGSAGAGSP